MQHVETTAPEANFNVAPSNDVRIVLDRNDHNGRDGGAGKQDELLRELRTASWGLVPFWAKDPKTSYKMINARIETLLDKPAYKAAARRRRCDRS